MKAILIIALAVILFQICSTFSIAADDQTVCYYLDKKKVQNKLMPVVLVKIGSRDKKDSIRLDKNGLFREERRLCMWSLNGGSGTKEQFSLDGDFAVPILDTACEAPFSHNYTGIGFGDWFLTLCGRATGENLYVNYGDDEYYVSVESLIQWTKYTPGQFPVKGDNGD